MIEDTNDGFRVILNEEQRRNVRRRYAELCFYWKHGRTELPANWTDADIETFIKQQDAAAKAEMDAEDAAQAAPAPPSPLPVPQGIPSLGGILLRTPPRPEAVEVEPEFQRPNAVDKLTGRK